MRSHVAWVSLCSTFLLVVGVQAVSAQTTTSATTELSDIALEATTNAATSSPEQAEKQIARPVRQLREGALDQAKQKRIVNLAANISNRLEAMIGRLDNIANRLDRRIAKMEIEGANVDPAKVELDKARLTLQSATDSLAPIDTVVYETVTSESPGTHWPRVKDVYTLTVAELKNAKQELVATLTLLKNPPTPTLTDVSTSSDEVNETIE